jgi:GAF domain-containing protein
VASGFAALLTDLETRYRAPAPPTRPGAVVCIGARWEIDGLGARMLAHTLSLAGYSATTGAIGPPAVEELAADVTTVCLSSFSSQPAAQLRLLAHRVRRRLPHARIFAAAWNLPADAVVARAHTAMDAEARSIQEIVQHLAVQSRGVLEDGAVPAPLPVDDNTRAAELHASGVLEPAMTAAYHDAAVQAANVFDVDYAQVSWVDSERVHTPGTLVPSKEANGGKDSVPRTHTICSYVVHDNAPVVVEDIARDPRFANNPLLAGEGVRFYAGVPLRDAKGRALGSFCILDKEPRALEPNELEVLETIAADLMEHVGRPVKT